MSDNRSIRGRALGWISHTASVARMHGDEFRRSFASVRPLATIRCGILRLRSPFVYRWVTCRCLLPFAAITLFSASPVFAQAADAASRFRIGVIVPLTGSAAELGEAVRNGLLLAYERLEPERRGQVELFYEDDASESSVAVSALQKLMAWKNINAVISAMSNSCNALAPIAEREKLPFIAIAFDPAISRGRQYAVTMWPRVEDLARLAVEEAQQRGYKKIVVVSTLHEGNLAQKKGFMEAAAGKLEIVAEYEILPTERDFRQPLARIRLLDGLDGIANLLHPAQVGLFARQARAQEVRLPSFSLGNYEDNTVVRDSAGTLVGEWYTAVNLDPQFIVDYQRRFPGSSIYGAPNAYDSLQIIAEAARQNLEPEQLPEFLQRLKDFKGVQGTFSASGDNRFLLPVVVKKVTEDGFVLVPRSGGSLLPQ